MYFSLLGIIISFITPKDHEFRFRWVFGFSISLLLILIGIFLTSAKESKATYIFNSDEQAYKAQIINSPKEKTNSIQLFLNLPEHDKNIVAYIDNTPLSQRLTPGDFIYFYSKLDTLRTYETPNNFDYAQFMHNKGISATTYISAQRWDFSEEKNIALETEALKIRNQILGFYKTLDLSDKEFAILSALTLGYKDSLPDDVIEDFRTTGTAHLLAISGLHIGILFFALSAAFSFIKSRKREWLKFSIILLLLWMYIFVIGLPASAIRAGIMISLFCIAHVINRRRVAFNTLAFAAFSMLIFNPLWLFDISFQFSFSATTFIIWLQPKADKLVKTKSKLIRFIWNTFSISFIAQLGTFPLAIFYFGYFPSYFFLSNLFIIPLAVGLVYIALLLLILSPFALLFSSGTILNIPIYLIKADIWLITSINSLIASFPFSQIADIATNNLSLILIYTVIVGAFFGIIKKQSRLIVFSLSCFAILLVNMWYIRSMNENKFSIYYGTEIWYNIHGQKFKIAATEKEKLIRLNNTKILFLSENLYLNLRGDNKYDLDYLILSGDQAYSLYDLTQVFKINKIILDSSLSKRSVKKLAKECQELGISYHDVRENDAYHIFF